MQISRRPRAAWCTALAMALIAAFAQTACGPKRADIERAIGSGGTEPHPLPATGSVAAFAFAESPGARSILATWVEAAPGAATGALRFSRFDGSDWTPPVTVVDAVRVADAEGRGPALSVLSATSLQILWFGAIDGGERTPRLEASSDGGETWTHLLELTPDIAPGNGPVSLVGAAAGLPLIAYIAPWKSPVQPLTDTALIAHPRLHVSGFEATYLVTHACTASGISAVGFAGHGVVAVRAFRSIESKGDGETNIGVYDIDTTGLTRLTAGDHDGWDMPAGARGVGPVLATRGRRIVYAYYSATRKGFPAILIFFGIPAKANTSHGEWVGFPDGVAIPVVGDAHDLSLHFSGDWIVVTAVEDGHLVEHFVGTRKFYSFYLDPRAIPTTTRVAWSGAIGEKNYVAWSNGTQVSFARALRGAPVEAGNTLSVTSGPDSMHYLGTPTPTPEQPPPAAELPGAPAP